MTTDQTPAVEVWARMLCAADVHVHGADHPTWQQLVGEPGRQVRDDYRKAARWLLPRMTVDPDAVLPAPADRPAVLLWAADKIDATFTGPGSDRYVRYGADLLRRLADEAPQPKAGAEPVEAAPVCESFQWIGQSFATCERCGQPAWDHVGEDVPAEGAGPFGTERTVRLWKPGEADAIRAKWAPAEGAQ